MMADFKTKPELAAINTPSAAAIWRHFLYLVAVAIHVMDGLFDEHTTDNLTTLAAMKPHRVEWYEQKALSFQHGFPLVPNQDYFDNTGYTEEEIEASKVVKFSRANRVFDEDNNLKGIRIKLATLDGGELAKVPDAQVEAFKIFIGRVGDAGVNVFASSGDPDSLKATIQIYYDPLVLAADGKRIDGTNDRPVQDAIDAFLKTEDFDREFITASFVDAMQEVPGVVIPHIVSIQATYGALPYTDIPVKYQPDSGYLRFINPADLTLNFIPHG